MGQVENVSVETDPAFDRALKAAVQRGGSDPDAVLNALVEELEITAPLRFSISGLGSGSAGQQGLDVVFQSGTNPNAAANNAATAWLPILRGLEGNGGAYSARASLVEVNGGYILAIGVKVEQPGDGGDEPEPVTLKSIAVNTPPAKTEYWVNETFDPTGMEITATYSNNTTTTINGITETDKKDVSWTPETLDTAGKQTVTISYGGKSTTVSVTVKEPAVKELKVEHTSLTYTAGAYFSPNQIGTVTASYTYGNDKEINISECDLILTLPDNTTAPVDSSYQFKTAGTYTITVSYKGGKATVNITVNQAALDSIQVTGPSMTVYEVGQTFNPTGLVVKAYDAHGNSTTVTGYTITIQNEDGILINSSEPFTTMGTYTLTVEYNKIKSAPITITVEHKGYIYDENSKTYYVSNENGLLAWNEAVQDDLTLNCTLTADINLAGKEWTPIGTDDNNSYNGTFDGNGKTITGLTVNQSEKNYAGLFGCLGSDGKVQNLTLENVDISGAFYVGSIVGTNFGTVSGCTASGNITGTESCIGGVVGQNKGTVTGCTVSGNISSKQYTGGVVGENFGTVSACYHATGDVTGNINYVGGVVGWNYYGTVTACYHVNGNVTATYNWVGSVAGYNGGVGSVTACYWNDSPDPGIGYDNGSGQATKVDSTDVTWKEAVDAMNTALKNAGSEWRYELKDGNSLPTLKKQ